MLAVIYQSLYVVLKYYIGKWIRNVFSFTLSYVLELVDTYVNIFISYLMFVD